MAHRALLETASQHPILYPEYPHYLLTYYRQNWVLRALAFRINHYGSQ